MCCMKTNLEHLPEDKRKEVEKIADIVRAEGEGVEMIILFGSHARGDWVEKDTYVEGYATYEYVSDFDVLLVVGSEKLERNHGVWNRIEKMIADDPSITTPVSFIVDTISFVNEQLAEGQYFYTDIKKEGVMLYDSGKFTLTEHKQLSADEERALKEEDYAMWTQKATDMLRRYTSSFELVREGERWNKIAAFDLHQAAEALYISFLLVCTGYRPKTHDLEKLDTRVTKVDQEFAGVFPREKEEDAKIFDLLRRAYVDARYKKEYSITTDELRQLAERIKKLQRLVTVRCVDKLKGLGERVA